MGYHLVHRHTKASLELLHILERRLNDSVDLVVHFPSSMDLLISLTLDHPIVRVCAPVLHHSRGGGQGICLDMDCPVWYTCGFLL